MVINLKISYFKVLKNIGMAINQVSSRTSTLVFHQMMTCHIIHITDKGGCLLVMSGVGSQKKTGVGHWMMMCLDIPTRLTNKSKIVAIDPTNIIISFS